MYAATALLLLIAMGLTLIRALKGPSVFDRILAVTFTNKAAGEMRAVELCRHDRGFALCRNRSRPAHHGSRGAGGGRAVMNLLLDLLSWPLLIGGGLLSIISATGVLRLAGLYARMHSATIMDTLGAGMVLLGLALQSGSPVVAFKLLLVFLLLALTTTTAAHALAKSALADGIFPHSVDPEIVKRGLSEAVHGDLRHPSEKHKGPYHPTAAEPFAGPNPSPHAPQEDPPSPS